jgi:hypothetical protein
MEWIDSKTNFFKVRQNLDDIESIVAKEIEEHRDKFFDLLSKYKKLDKFIRENLGVVGAGFGIADIGHEKFILTENSKLFEYDKEFPTIDFDFSVASIPSEIKESVGYAINILYHGRRRLQQDFYGSDVPEYYLHLDNALPYSKFLISTHSKYTSDSPTKNNPHHFHVLHCPPEEVLFCIYAWRWLIRSVQAVGNIDANVRYELNIELRTDVPPLWEHKLWPEGTLENDILVPNPIEKVKGEIKDGNKIKSAQAGWNWLSKRANDNVSVNFIDELENLGLLKNKKPTPAWEPFIRYALHILNQILSKNSIFNHSKEPELYEKVQMAGVIIENVQKSSLHDRNIDEFVKAIQIVIYTMLRWLPSETESTPTYRNFLLKLHRIARIPLIPYYYVTVADRVAKQHLIVPLLNTKSYPIRHSVPKNLEQNTDRVDAVTYSIVLAVMMIKSGWEQESMSKSGKPLNKTDQIWLIRNVFQRLALPIIDQGVFGHLVPENKHIELAFNFSHAIATFPGQIIKQIQSAHVWDKLNPITRGLLLILKTTLSQYQGKPYIESGLFSMIDDQLHQSIEMSAALAIEKSLEHEEEIIRDFALNLDSIESFIKKIAWPDLKSQKNEKYRNLKLPDSFIIMTVYILKQAMFHTMAFKVLNPNLEDYRVPQMILKKEGTQLVLKVSNPGKESPHTPKDREELKDLGKYLFKKDCVFGPSWENQERMWVTGFKIPYANLWES